MKSITEKINESIKKFEKCRFKLKLSDHNNLLILEFFDNYFDNRTSVFLSKDGILSAFTENDLSVGITVFENLGLGKYTKLSYNQKRTYNIDNSNAAVKFGIKVKRLYTKLISNKQVSNYKIMVDEYPYGKKYKLVDSLPSREFILN